MKATQLLVAAWLGLAAWSADWNAAQAQDIGVPSRSGRRISVFIPPIGRFGGFSGEFGRGHVNVNVGPSGSSFGGVNVGVFRPQPIYRPAVVYGPAPIYAPPVYGPGVFGPAAGRSVVIGPNGVVVEGAYGRRVIVVTPNPYLGVVGGNGEIQPGPLPYGSDEAGSTEQTAPELGTPSPAPAAQSAAPPTVPAGNAPNQKLDDLLPAPPGGSISGRPSAGEPKETVVPKRSNSGDSPSEKSGASGPALNGPALNGPALNGPSLNNPGLKVTSSTGTQPPMSFAQPVDTVAPRLFPVRGTAFFPPGFVPRNGFDVDGSLRPNAPVRPGNDPFGPTLPAVDPETLPAT